jgi:hypothetical protein
LNLLDPLAAEQLFHNTCCTLFDGLLGSDSKLMGRYSGGTLGMLHLHALLWAKGNVRSKPGGDSKMNIMCMLKLLHIFNPNGWDFLQHVGFSMLMYFNLPSSKRRNDSLLWIISLYFLSWILEFLS